MCIVILCVRLLFRRSKTPGGKIVYLYPGKRGTVPKCGDCKCKLRGVSEYSAEIAHAWHT